jgi:hypothetical protein
MHHSKLPPIDWVKRVNSSWLVRGGLDRNASAWLEHLESSNDERLLPSCESARQMCELRHRMADPKPWFYAGLFSMATAAEAARFLESHRTTRAAIPSTADDEAARLWLDRAGPETRELIKALRAGIAASHRSRPADGG